MTPTASPRHPWKALAVVLAALVVAHGARATVGSHDHGFRHVHVVDGSTSWAHCPSVDIDEDDDTDNDADDPAMDDIDDDWS